MTGREDISAIRLADERARLVRLCAHLTRSVDAAEDLAQETLIEAWRHADRLEEAQSQQAWLTGIARNVCRRWLRADALDRNRRYCRQSRVRGVSVDSSGGPSIEDIADDIDLFDHIANAELADVILDGLMNVPTRTREMILARYGDGCSHAEIAIRFRMSENAVAVALHRGTRQLRDALLSGSGTGSFLADWDIDARERDAWSETRIWCIRCGSRKLVGRFDRDSGFVAFRCPECHQDGTHTASHTSPELFTGVSGYKPALNRLLTFWHKAWVRGCQDGRTVCHLCGSFADYHVGMPDRGPLRNEPGAHFRCPACGPILDMTISGLPKTIPHVRRFWNAHARIRTLPRRSIERDGEHVTVVRLESIAVSAWIDVLFATETCAPIEVHESHGG